MLSSAVLPKLREAQEALAGHGADGQDSIGSSRFDTLIRSHSSCARMTVHVHIYIYIETHVSAGNPVCISDSEVWL